MKKHYETHVEDTDKLISVAGPVLDYKSWYEQYWKPSMATASLWKVVDEEHEGTIDDPIIYIPPMEIFKDKYYIQNGIKYKCTRNSEQPLTHDLSALVGLYVETI